MTSTKQIFDEAGILTAEEREQQKLTVSFEHSLTQYGNGPKAGVHIQVPVGIGASIEEVEQATKRWSAFAKSHVYNELGIPISIVDGQVVPQIEAAPAPQAKTTGHPPARPKPAGGGKSDDTAAWLDVKNNPGGWFDNRTDKKNPKGPDFKGKNNNAAYAGKGLWMDSKPSDIEL